MWRILRSFLRFLSNSYTSPSKRNFEIYVRVLCENLAYTFKIYQNILNLTIVMQAPIKIITLGLIIFHIQLLRKL